MVFHGLLRHGRRGYPLTRIADEAGFKDYNYFVRVFKKHIGMPSHESFRDA